MVGTVIILLTCSQMAHSQSWPLQFDNVLTSSFGPRNLGGQNDDNYPHPWGESSFFGYNYDFHRGLDMYGLKLWLMFAQFKEENL